MPQYPGIHIYLYCQAQANGYYEQQNKHMIPGCHCKRRTKQAVEFSIENVLILSWVVAPSIAHSHSPKPALKAES